ncbi:MAG: hypothetical protein Q9174_003529 [Haloplaca sp. 1 TL-2023]
MYSDLATVFLLTTFFHSLVTSQPINQPLSLPSPLSPSSTPLPAFLKDSETYIYPLFRTTFILRGRIFTSLPLNATSVHTVLTGMLEYTQKQVATLGPEARMSSGTIGYRVPGPNTRERPTGRTNACLFRVTSETDEEERPVMTWDLLKDTMLGLKEVLERDQTNFENTFVVVDGSGRNVGHGAVIERLGPAPGPPPGY